VRAVEIAPLALSDLGEILAWSESRFGPATADRYRALIEAALDDIREDPERRGVRPVGARRLYHLRSSRSRLFGETVAEPRHFLVFRATPEVVTLLRVLHDAMDLPARATDQS